MLRNKDGLTYAYIFDIDGTIADCKHRLHYIKPPAGLVHFEPGETDWKPDWDSFYDNCDKDEEIQPVCEVLAALAEAGFDILFVTGRPESCRQKTMAWLKEHFGVNMTDSHKLFMRLPEHGFRADYVSKACNYNERIKHKWKVLGAFEDRDQCVRMWRDLGIQCFQVADGAY